MSILDFAASTGWAMLEDKATQMVEIAERTHTASPQVLEAYKAQSLERSQRAKVRDGTAILYAEGPLFKKASFFTEISGATSYEVLMKDHRIALDDPDVHSIIIATDSPGGEANGCDELAAAIFAGRSIKPTVAYVSGMAASGGYWIASAADRIFISDAALLGSIGVVLGMRDRTEADEKNGIKNTQFVSSQSPGKRPDHNTAEGRSQIQAMVDDMADVFISAVARFRGVTVEQVIEKFGAGGVKVGAKAVAAGMADEVGSFEAAFASVNERGIKVRNSNRSFGGLSMSENTNTGPSREEIANTARTETQTRIKTIMGCDAGKKMPALANHLAFDTDVSAVDAGKIMTVALEDMPKVEDKPKPAEGEGRESSFDERRAQAGSLGFGGPEPTVVEQQATRAKAGWSKAVSDVNSSHFNQ